MYKIMSLWIHTLFIKLFILIYTSANMKVYLRVALVQMCMLYKWIVLFATAAGSAFQTFLAPSFRILKSYSPTSDSCSNEPQKDTLPVDFCLPNAIDSANLLLAYLGLSLASRPTCSDCLQIVDYRLWKAITNDLQVQGVRSQTDERLCESHERLGVFLSSRVDRVRRLLYRSYDYAVISYTWSSRKYKLLCNEPLFQCFDRHHFWREKWSQDFHVVNFQKQYQAGYWSYLSAIYSGGAS